MSFWTLQEEDMRKQVYLVPQILKFSRSKTSWGDIIKFKRRTHMFMLAMSISLGSMVALSTLFIAGISYLVMAHSRAPHHTLIGIMYVCMDVFLLYAATRIIQSCVRLVRFLRQNTLAEAE